MFRITKLLSLFALLGFATHAYANEGEGVAPAAAKLVDFGNGWAITNSMATGWAVSAFIIGLIIVLTGIPVYFLWKLVRGRQRE